MVKIPRDPHEIIIGEDENIKSIVVQIDETNYSTTILSDYLPEENVDFLLEAAAANAKELINQGEDKDKVIKDLRDLFEQIVEAYLGDDE